MKTAKYQKRFYRDLVHPKCLYESKIIEKETDLQVFTDKKVSADFLRTRVRLLRWQIENYISKDKRFLTALKPIAIDLKAPPVVRNMGRAAKAANVGPMAAVAGAIADLIGKDLSKKGCKEIIIENGGDIFLKSGKNRYVGLYAGKSKIWKDLSLKIKPRKKPLGVCASSGTIGHSLSFGCADSVVILADNATLADAAATAVANRVQNKESMGGALAFSRSIPGVLGAVIIINDHLISWGDFEFVN
jgi:ApbE superfamily uncharacterized protein (UPF0280 family)